MARVPYADISDETIAPLVSRIQAERDGVPHLYSMLLQSRDSGRMAHLSNGYPAEDAAGGGGLEKLVIIRIAQLNNAPYEGSSIFQ